MSFASEMTSRFVQRNATALLTAGAVVVLACLALLPTPLSLVGVLLGLVMLVIASIDADRFIIPDRLSLPAIPTGLVASGRLLDPGVEHLVATGHVAGAVVAAGAMWGLAVGYRWWRGADGLGLGDVKLAAAAGAWVGLEHVSDVLLLSAGTGLLWAIAISCRHGVGLDGRMRVPFGAFLAPSIWIVWLALAAGLGA